LTASGVAYLDPIQAVAATLGLQVRYFTAQDPKRLIARCPIISAMRPDGLIVESDATLSPIERRSLILWRTTGFPPSMAGGRDEQLNRMAGVSPSSKTFTPKQGQYLAYIHLYTRLHRRSPAEADIQQYLCVTPPSVHQMVVTLERAGFIRRQPRVARSIELLVDPKLLPELL